MPGIDGSRTLPAFPSRRLFQGCGRMSSQSMPLPQAVCSLPEGTHVTSHSYELAFGTRRLEKATRKSGNILLDRHPFHHNPPCVFSGRRPLCVLFPNGVGWTSTACSAAIASIHVSFVGHPTDPVARAYPRHTVDMEAGNEEADGDSLQLACSLFIAGSSSKPILA